MLLVLLIIAATVLLTVAASIIMARASNRSAGPAESWVVCWRRWCSPSSSRRGRARHAAAAAHSARFRSRTTCSTRCGDCRRRVGAQLRPYLPQRDGRRLHHALGAGATRERLPATMPLTLSAPAQAKCSSGSSSGATSRCVPDQGRRLPLHTGGLSATLRARGWAGISRTPSIISDCSTSNALCRSSTQDGPRSLAVRWTLFRLQRSGDGASRCVRRQRAWHSMASSRAVHSW